MSVESRDDGTPRGAVFLSYASQDADAARRICEALRAAGVEVWFDQSELRGGDAWDAKIRKQIKECALFVPVISANTQARPEGYFRLEWKLAVDRSHLMADDQPFLLPVVIDDISEAAARVPDRFRDVQWTRLMLEETPTQFGERVRALLTDQPEPESRAARHVEQRGRARQESALATLLSYWWLAFPFFGMAMFFRSTWWPDRPEAPASVATPSQTEAKELVARAREIFDRGDLTRENLRTAEEFCDRAIAADAMEAEAWAARAQVHAWWVFYRYDATETRKARASADASRAVNLAPRSHEARLAHAAVLAKVVALPAARDEAEKVLLELSRERPVDARVFDHLGLVARAQGKKEEAAEYFMRANNPGGAAWTYFESGDFALAMDAVERALQKDRALSSLTLKASLEYRWREDLDAAQRTINELPGSTMLDESYAMTSIWIALYRRDSAKALRLVQALPGDYFSALGYSGPKAALLAYAHEMAGRAEAAKAEWRAALRTIESRLAGEPNNPELLWWKASSLAGLGDLTAAGEQLRLALELGGAPREYVGADIAGVLIRIGEGDRVMDWLEQRFRERPPRWEMFHSAARFHRDFDPLRGNERFERLLKENVPIGAKPF